MPAKSQAQANLIRAAEHGATFKMAEQIRRSMSPTQMHEFAVTKSKSLPVHVPTPKMATTTKMPHANLGKYLHPKKGR